MPSGHPDIDPPRAPSGRLRLAAALGGAGVLAMGLGAGVMQAESQESPAGAPGDQALGAQDPATVPATSSPSTATSSTATTATASTASATPLPAAAEPAAPEPAPAAPAAPASAPAPEQPAAEQPAAPAEPSAAPAGEPAPAPAPSPEPKATDAKDEPEEEVCAPGEEEVLTAAGAEQPAATPATPATPAAPTAPDATELDAPEPQCETPEPAPKRKRKAGDDKDDRRARSRPAPAPIRTAGGAPTVANPTASIVMPGPAAIGVPNFFIDRFRIPPFLLPIYQAAGMEYGIRWEILAAINEIETDYGRNLNVSSAGALGWMQFMPPTWKAYGVDANGDGRKDPYNPVDAIFAAANYLAAAGGEKDLRKAIFAYNHADWYVDSVLMRARLVGGLPADLVGSLTGLTEGRFPLEGKARYADDLDERKATRRIARGSNAALPVDPDENRRGITVFAEPGTRAVATHDGEVVKRGTDARLGRYVQIRDAHGNTYTYGRLKSLEASHPVPKSGAKPDRTPTPVAEETAVEPVAGDADVKERLFAHPRRPKAMPAGGAKQIGVPQPKGRDEYVKDLLGLKPDQVTWKALKTGSRVVSGTVLGSVGKTTSTRSPHLYFEVRPAGRGAPRVDPKPILDGWKLLESTAIYRANAKNPFHGKDAKSPTIGQILLMSKASLQRRVLRNPRVLLTQGGRFDVRAGRLDRRVLALLEFLAANGLEPTVSSTFREGSITTSGNLSHHATGTAVDISAVNGVPVIGHQGKGSITDLAIRRMLGLQGAMKPDQIISLMTYPDASNTLAMGDHADHIHVGFTPVGGKDRKGGAASATLKPGQWFKVIDRLNEIENPVVRKTPSSASLKVTPRRRAR